MTFRPRRQARITTLKRYGLLPYEAIDLSRLSIAEMRSMPYIMGFIRFRNAWANRVADRVEYKRQINDHYRKQGWLKRKGWAMVGDIWQWIRRIEERYKRDHPDYETPPSQAGKKKRKKYIRWQ